MRVWSDVGVDERNVGGGSVYGHKSEKRSRAFEASETLGSPGAPASAKLEF